MVHVSWNLDAVHEVNFDSSFTVEATRRALNPGSAGESRCGPWPSFPPGGPGGTMSSQRPRFTSTCSRFTLAAWLFAGVLGCGGGLDAESSASEPELRQSEQGLTQVTGFGSNPGNLAMYRHVPTGVPANAPLVVVLHGCTQNATGMEASGWTAAANVYKFYVVYPQQSSGNNATSCFNWFEPGDIARGSGEALSIKQMVDAMKAAYSIDASRVYVVGFSAGGYMAPALLATYPDVFSAGAINAGGPYKCATTMNAAFSCMSPG